MKKPKMMMIVATSLLLGVVSGCSSSENVDATDSVDATDELNIWYVNPLTTYPAWADSMAKFEAAATDGGYEATGVGTTTIDTPGAVSLIEQAITDDADGIIFCNIDPTAYQGTIEKAQDAGIVMVTIGCVSDETDYSIGTDNSAFGATAAQTIADGAGENAVVAIISTDQTTPNQVEQVESFNAEIESNFPGVRVAAWESSNSDSSVAAQKITALLSANPDITAIWCVEGQCPGGVESGLREAGKEPGDIYVLGIDTVETTIAALEDGWINATLNQCWFDATPLAVELIRSVVEGDPNPQQSWGVGVDAVTKSDLPYGGCAADLVPTLN
ncbi:MAG: sugar ABC transporter substrate-binding protein [Microcella sp.]|uniref:sugar ABC transporter substrate-binding protein n=1 Tax=Microcella sp. TaxID=1913979 RepID=UPI003314BFC8